LEGAENAILMLWNRDVCAYFARLERNGFLMAAYHVETAAVLGQGGIEAISDAAAHTTLEGMRKTIE
jgi:hypothetical protein